MHARRPFLEIRAELLHHNPSIMYFSNISIVQQVCILHHASVPVRISDPQAVPANCCNVRSTNAEVAHAALNVELRRYLHLVTAGSRCGAGGGLQRDDAGAAARPAHAGHLSGALSYSCRAVELVIWSPATWLGK